MAEKFFEIAFNGVIKPGADLEQVKQKLGKMFKADETRLAQLFSGKRVPIKRRADEITMIKFRAAFQKAGAICEIVELTDEAEASVTAATASNTSTTDHSGAEYVSKYPESDEVPQALLSTPLAVNGDQIEDLAADLAPVGSQLLHEYIDPPTPDIDISEFDIAPVGVMLSPQIAEATPPLPDTSGLSLAQ